MTDVNIAIDHLVEAIADHLGIPKCDHLSMPDKIRDALTELRTATGRSNEDYESDESKDEVIDELRERVDELERQQADIDLLRSRLAEAVGLPSWQWRKLPSEIAELLE
jgi:hypothetical protein